MVKQELYRKAAGCRICGCSDFAKVIDLGDQSLTGRFPGTEEADPPKAPLELVRCRECGLVQLLHSVNLDEMFGDNYGYRSGVTTTMKAHLGAIVQSISDKVDLNAGDIVLDIGCNDGTLLNHYCADGIIRIGIDPTANMFRDLYSDDLIVHAGFFDARSFTSVSPRPKAKAISSISMFYDLEDPGSFVKDIASVLDREGVWVLEQSYLPTMLEKNSFDTICHEHLEYYSLAQITALACEYGLRVFDVSLNAINGGSFQVFVCHDEASFKANDLAISALAKKEEAMSLDTDEPFNAFRDRVSEIGNELRAFIVTQVQDGKKVYVYGASTKGNVLLQYFELDSNLITACAERSPRKWGCRTPGTNIPIVSEEDARKEADYFLVLPWHFREEFIKREHEFLSQGGKFIFPLPKFEVI